MAKTKTRYVCQACGAESSKWLAAVLHATNGNSFVEEVVVKEVSRLSDRPAYAASAPIPIGKVDFTERKRIDTTFREVNRTLGGGLVPGSMVLLGGEPGIGKSTLALQLALKMKDIKTLYISGEESAEQIKLRAIRLGDGNDNCHILCETSLKKFFQHLSNLRRKWLSLTLFRLCRLSILNHRQGAFRKSANVHPACCDLLNHRSSCHSHWPYCKRWFPCRAKSTGAHGGHGIAV